MIHGNITRSFPDKSAAEIETITRKFYTHFTDLIIESIKGFTLSEKQIRKRFVFTNPEVLEPYFALGKDVIATGGHYNNWEYLALGLCFYTKHAAVGIYSPLKNEFFNQLMLTNRTRFGLYMCPTKETVSYFKKDMGRPKIMIFGSDQSPSNPKKAFWTKFLNQPTALTFGAEKYAKDFDTPVFFCNIHKVKRGHYTADFQLITDKPNEMPYGAIVTQGAQFLEKQINQTPHLWLWSHKRWKHKAPADFEMNSAGENTKEKAL